MSMCEGEIEMLWWCDTNYDYVYEIWEMRGYVVIYGYIWDLYKKDCCVEKCMSWYG